MAVGLQACCHVAMWPMAVLFGVLPFGRRLNIHAAFRSHRVTFNRNYWLTAEIPARICGHTLSWDMRAAHQPRTPLNNSSPDGFTSESSVTSHMAINVVCDSQDMHSGRLKCFG